MKIALLGDIGLFGSNTVKNPLWKGKFAPIKAVLDECDYVVGNLETPLTNCKKVVGGKSAYIKGSPEDVEILKYIGVTHVTLANNHMFDYKKQGLEETIEVLEKAGIEWYGVNGKQAVIGKEDNHLVLMGYCCYSTNGKGLRVQRPYINVLDPAVIEKEIMTAGEEGLLPILSFHWGQEHVHYPNYDHVLLARKLASICRIIIHGHHPHVIQGIEKVNDSLIAYSLGNFCFDDVYTNKSKEPLVKLSDDNREVAIFIIEIKQNIILKNVIKTFIFDINNYASDSSEGTIYDKIKIWSEYIYTEETEYRKNRKAKLDAYISNRKSKRDFKWYLKRMNFDSVKMLIAEKMNLNNYKNTVLAYIK